MNYMLQATTPQRTSNIKSFLLIIPLFLIIFAIIFSTAFACSSKTSNDGGKTPHLYMNVYYNEKYEYNPLKSGALVADYIKDYTPYLSSSRKYLADYMAQDQKDHPQNLWFQWKKSVGLGYMITAIKINGAWIAGSTEKQTYWQLLVKNAAGEWKPSPVGVSSVTINAQDSYTFAWWCVKY